MDEWLKIFEETDLPYGPINNMKEAFEDVQVKHNSIVQTIENENFSSPIKLAGISWEKLKIFFKN